MFLKWTLPLAAGLMAIAPAFAADETFQHWTDADANAALTAPRSTPPATQLMFHPGYQIILTSRNKSGGVEQHMNWNEIFIVQDGSATFNYGGTSVGAKEVRPGEMMGDSVSGGQTLELHKGDIVKIPAGTPHQMILASGATIRYMDIKGPKD